VLLVFVLIAHFEVLLSQAVKLMGRLLLVKLLEMVMAVVHLKGIVLTAVLSLGQGDVLAAAPLAVDRYLLLQRVALVAFSVGRVAL